MKPITIASIILGALITLLAVVPPATAATTTTVTTSWYDTNMVKTAVLKAYWKQSYSTRQIICNRWRANPQARPFVNMALIAYRNMPSVSTREAAKGVVKAFNSVCY